MIMRRWRNGRTCGRRRLGTDGGAQWHQTAVELVAAVGAKSVDVVAVAGDLPQFPVRCAAAWHHAHDDDPNAGQLHVVGVDQRLIGRGRAAVRHDQHHLQRSRKRARSNSKENVKSRVFFGFCLCPSADILTPPPVRAPQLVAWRTG